jgi:hypothetical protein
VAKERAVGTRSGAVERSGAFLGDGFQNIPVPIRTLSDEYHDTPEPEEFDRVPDPEPDGIVARALRRLIGRRTPDQA